MTGTSAQSRRPAVDPSRTVTALAHLIAVLAVIAAAAGLFWSGGEAPPSFTSPRGETVEPYGHGVYRYDSLFAGAGNRGTDAVTLLLGAPLLVASARRYARGSLRGALLLLGALTWFLYAYASYALGLAYNELFLLYVVLLSASLFGLLAAFRTVDASALPAHAAGPLPRRGLGPFMLASGAVTLVVWLSIPLGAMLEGSVPIGLARSSGRSPGSCCSAWSRSG